MNQSLEKARSLKLPLREETLQRSLSVQKFWNENQALLEEAWREWEIIEGLAGINESVIDARLRERVDLSWQNPVQEKNILELLKEVSPGVYEFQFFNPEKLEELRNFFKKVEKAEIPLRAPYGIALNRKGAMLDKRSEGYLAPSLFQDFYKVLMDKYMRPISRLLFPEITGLDTQTFGFSIQYQAGIDTSLRMHTDASSVTLNINMNFKDEYFTGSEVDFIDPNNGKRNRVSFKPGSAMIHRGNIAHEAQPITSGERSNLVLWLYGDRMLIPTRWTPSKEFSPEERWSIPVNEYDRFAPF